MLDAWLDGMLHFPPFDTNRFKPSIEICDGLTLSKNGFNIWAQIESFSDSDIINGDSRLFTADDFNFNGYQYNQMELMCRYSLPLKTHYPKLAVILYLHPKFKEWIEQQELVIN